MCNKSAIVFNMKVMERLRVLMDTPMGRILSRFTEDTALDNEIEPCQNDFYFLQQSKIKLKPSLGCEHIVSLIQALDKHNT